MKYKTTKTISLIMVLILLLGAFTGCGNSSSNEEDVIPPLSAEKELEFKELFYNKYKDNYPLLTLDTVKVNYLGEFNGSYAVMFKFTLYEYQTDSYEVVGGFEYAYQEIQPITIINGDDMYGLEEAYNSGLVNNDDLSVLFKRYRPTCNATVDTDFELTTIFVKVLPSYNFKEYTVEDFSKINCIEVSELFTNKEYKEGELDRWLVLKIVSFSKRTTLKAIKKLEQRDDVYFVEPNYILEEY